MYSIIAATISTTILIMTVSTFTFVIFCSVLILRIRRRDDHHNSVDDTNSGGAYVGIYHDNVDNDDITEDDDCYFSMEQVQKTVGAMKGSDGRLSADSNDSGYPNPDTAGSDSAGSNSDEVDYTDGSDNI